MNYIRIVVGIILCFLFVAVFILPDRKENIFQAKVDQFPEYSFQKESGLLLKKGNWQAAVTLLDVLIDQQQGGREPVEDKHAILERHLSKATLTAKLNSFGWLDLTRKGNAWEQLTTGGVADFFAANVANATDIIPTEKHRATFQYMENLNVMKELWPEAPAAVNMLKCAVNDDLFTAAFYKHLLQKFELIKDTEKLNPVAVKQVLESVVPVWELLKVCRTWYQFKTMMQQVEGVAQVKFFLELTNQNYLNTDRLVQMLTLMGNDGEKISEMLSYLKTYQQMGINRLYGTVLKGPAALQFMAAHPGFTINVSRQAFPGNVVKWWEAQLLKSRSTAEIVRHLILWLIGVVIILLFAPEKNLIPLSAGLLLFVTLVFLFHMFFVPVDHPISEPTVPGGVETAAGGTAGTEAMMQPAKPKVAYQFGADSMLALMIIVFLQGAACYKALGEFKSVKGMRASYQGKLQQLDNVDIFFDLPLYLGLLGTISSFIIMLFNPDASRIVAYSSTIVGIIISACLRVFYLYPLRKELLSNIDFDK